MTQVTLFHSGSSSWKLSIDMALKLSSTSAIIEKVKSLGEDSSFKGRKRLFNEAELDKRLEQYVGSDAQNFALIDALDNPKLSGEVGK